MSEIEKALVDCITIPQMEAIAISATIRRRQELEAHGITVPDKDISPGDARCVLEAWVESCDER